MDQDFSATESNNLIMADDIQVSQKPAKSANPLYDLENEDSSLEPSANPLYDLSENKADINGHNVDYYSQKYRSLMDLKERTQIALQLLTLTSSIRH
jgi:hypothetical protein